jgi:hypothetical protein
MTCRPNRSSMEQKSLAADDLGGLRIHYWSSLLLSKNEIGVDQAREWKSFKRAGNAADARSKFEKHDLHSTSGNRYPELRDFVDFLLGHA